MEWKVFSRFVSPGQSKGNIVELKEAGTGWQAGTAWRINRGDGPALKRQYLYRWIKCRNTPRKLYWWWAGHNCRNDINNGTNATGRIGWTEAPGKMASGVARCTKAYLKWFIKYQQRWGQSHCHCIKYANKIVVVRTTISTTTYIHTNTQIFMHST